MKLYYLCSAAVFVLGLVCNGQTDNPDATVITPPTSVVAPLGDANATFNCTVENSELLRWEVNELRFNDDDDAPVLLSKQIFQVGPTEDPQNRTTSSVLVATTHDNNQTMIQCFARGENNVLVSSNVAVLTIYGPPDSPTNVSVSELGLLQLNVSWTAVPTLSDVSVTYRINVTNLGTLEVFMSDEVNSTSFVFEGTEPSCDTYKFSVTAVNTAGESSPSDVMNASLPTLPTQPVSNLDHSVELLPGVTLCMFTFTAAETCLAYPVTHYFLLLRNIETNATLLLGPYPSVDTNRISVNTSDGIEDNSHYEYRIIAHNQVGALASELGEFYTTDVQEVEVDRENRLYIRCYFAQGSEALGCSVELVSPEDSVLWNITRENGLLVAERNIMTALPAHCYNISVSELERDGTVGEVAVLVVEAEWNESCNPDSNPGSGAPPTSGTGAGSISSARSPSPESNPSDSSDDYPLDPIILAALFVAGIIILLLVVAVLIVAISLTVMKMKRKKRHACENKIHGKRLETQVTQETIIPLYDAIDNYKSVRQESVTASEMEYNTLNRSDQLSPQMNGKTPEYSQLNQVPIYHVLECNPSPVESPPPVHLQPEYSEIADLHTSRPPPPQSRPPPPQSKPPSPQSKPPSPQSRPPPPQSKPPSPQSRPPPPQSRPPPPQSKPPSPQSRPPPPQSKPPPPQSRPPPPQSKPPSPQSRPPPPQSKPPSPQSRPPPPQSRPPPPPQAQENDYSEIPSAGTTV